MHAAKAAPSWPMRALLYPARHVRWKIIAPYALLTIALALAGTYMVTRLVGGSLEERFDNQLAEAARVTSDSLVRRERKHLETVRGVAFTTGVAAAVAAGDTAQVSRLVEPLAANHGVERIEVLDATGRRVFGERLADTNTLAYGPLADDPSDRASWPAVQSVLNRKRDDQGDKFAQIAPTPDGYALYTAGPIYDGDRLAGVVMVGSLLQTFLPSAKSEALADITIYDTGGTPLASTFSSTDPAEANLAARAEVLADAGTKPVREHKKLFGRDFDLLYGKLVVRNETVGYYSAGLPSSFIFSTKATTRMRMGVLFAIATAAVLLVGWFISRSITNPVAKLVATANAVRAGDLLARCGVRGRDEIGVLGEAFDAMTERLQRQHLSTIMALTSAIDARDPYTMGHSLRVGQLAVELGIELGLSPSQIQHLEIGGYLHDVGKIGVRDAVLLKAGALDPDERAAIERHPQIGLDILQHVDLAPDVVEFVGAHHEKLNGSGYPSHLLEGQISIVPRIAAVADIYDALTTDRPYRPGMTITEALKILRSEARQGQLDPAVIDALECVIPRWERRLQTEDNLRGFKLWENGVPKAA